MPRPLLDPAGGAPLAGDGELAPADAATAGLPGKLLPDWEEDWLMVERELVDVHLAEGNRIQTRRHLDQYARLLWDEMRLRPSNALAAWVGGAAR